MEYLLTCKCGKTTVVNRSQAGQELKCSCGQPLLVPTLRGLSELPAARPAENSIVQDAQHSVWRGWRGPTMAAATAIFAVTMIFCARALLQRASVDTSYTTQQEIAVGEQIIDSYDPQATSLSWRNFSQFQLGSKDRPMFYLAEKYAREREMIAAINGTVAAIFALIAVSVLISARMASKKSSQN